MKIAIRMLAVFCLLIVIFSPQIQTFAQAAAVFNPAKIEFPQIASGLTQPLFITNARDGSGRLFIVERAGRIKIIKNSSLLSVPFLDIHTIVNSKGGEEGLLALAFHPNYSANGQFYTVYTNPSGSLVLSRFIRSATNPDLADPNSRITLLTINHPTYQNHNGGTLAFGPDGYLYWSTGDGGGGGDPANNAQNLSSLLGKILRLDVDSGSPYSIPASNPFFNNPNPSIRKEIWAYGLRNPWRLSFDRQTGDLYIGDVGQQTREEIDFQPANSTGGNNYGWRVMEGSLCYKPASGCNRSGKVLPVAEYDHSVGCAVTGGYVYRGNQAPPLQGYYFYGDFCTGVLFSLHNSTTGWTVTQIADTPYFISSFGEDENGELYLADYTGGRIYQIKYNPDTLPPGDITGFTATTGASNGTVNLGWVAPPDDAGNNNSGPVAAYLVRYSTSPIASETDWNNATVVNKGLPTPLAPGSTQTMTVFGLNAGTLYYFAIRAQDEQPNLSVNFATASATAQLPVATGTYDDTHPDWTYNGNYTVFASSSAYQGGIHYTTTVGNSAEFIFRGSQISILYTGNSNRGKVDVFLDGNPTKIATFDEYTALAVFQKRWTSGDLGTGTHTIRLVHAGAAGTTVNIDAIEVGTYQAPVPPGAGTYDNLDSGWAYNGNFITFISPNAYQGSIHYTTAVGDSAEFTFTGSQFILVYTGNTNRGKVNVFVDGSSTAVATIDERTATAAFQQHSATITVGAGTHTVRLVHAGPTGATVNIDAIEVFP